MPVLREEADDAREGAWSPASHLLLLLQSAVQVAKGIAMMELGVAAIAGLTIFLAGLVGLYLGDR